MTEPERLVDEDARREELRRAPKSSPDDAAPRIVLSEGADGATRIDIAETAVVRPGRTPDDSGADADTDAGADSR